VPPRWIQTKDYHDTVFEPAQPEDDWLLVSREFVVGRVLRDRSGPQPAKMRTGAGTIIIDGAFALCVSPRGNGTHCSSPGAQPGALCLPKDGHSSSSKES
jgi:hypothetical protein